MQSTIERQRDRILKAIQEQPGISLTELYPKTQLMDSSTRSWCLADLIASGRIIETKERQPHGPPKSTYRVAAPGEVAPAVKSPKDRIADSLFVIEAELSTIRATLQE
jgi:hypothetical protein